MQNTQHYLVAHFQATSQTLEIRWQRVAELDEYKSIGVVKNYARLDISEASEKFLKGQECFQIVVLVAENYSTIYIKLWLKVCLPTS